MNVGSNTALGSGGVTLTSGAIQASTAGITLGNHLTFSNAGSVSFAGSNSFTLGGTVTLNGSDTINASDTGGTTLTGNITNTAPTDTLNLAGSGTLNLPNPNSDTTTTILSGATVNVGSNTALGSGGVTLTSGTIQASTTGITLGNLLTFSNAGSVSIGGTNALTLGGTVTLNGSDSIDVGDTSGATIGGVIGAGNLTLTDTQTLNLPTADPEACFLRPASG